MDSSNIKSAGSNGHDDDGCRIPGDRKFLFFVVIFSFVLIYFFLFNGAILFHWLFANLPLILPLAVTVLSIFTRAAYLRNYESVLKMSNDVAIGIISFDIWAISAKSSDQLGRVMVNPTTMINGDFVIPLLLSGLLISVGCVVLTQYKFSNVRIKQRFLFVGFIASIVIYIVPFGILEVATPQNIAGANLRKFTVVIPYEDPGITRLAPTILRDRLFAQFERDIEANNQSDAKNIALQQFLDSDDSNPYRKNINDNKQKVIVKKSKILVFDQQALTVSRK